MSARGHAPAAVTIMSVTNPATHDRDTTLADRDTTLADRMDHSTIVE